MKDSLPSSSGHRKRVKDKFLKLPLRSFADYEILELALFYALPRVDTKPLAKQLIKKYGSLINILNADPLELKKFKGTGDNLILFFKLLADVFSRCHLPVDKNIDILSNWSSVIQYCQHDLGFRRKEFFRVLFLNKRNALIADELFDAGTIDRLQIYPREVAKKALEHSASAIILVHNHPSGNCEPSQEDITTTRDIMNALELLDIKLHDHLIIAGLNHFSFRAANLI